MIEIRIDHAEVSKALEAAPAAMADAFEAGAIKGALDVINSPGLQVYPPADDANRPPTPYYIRGRGTQRAGRRKPEYNDNRSERLGTQFYTEPGGRFVVKVGNRASYAPFVVGQDQAWAMGQRGWRKLHDVAMDKIGTIAEEVDRAISSVIDRILR